MQYKNPVAAEESVRFRPCTPGEKVRVTYHFSTKVLYNEFSLNAKIEELFSVLKIRR